jgi:hypothetical protein
MQATNAKEVDLEVRALMVVVIRTLKYVIRWLERRYGVATNE